MSRFCQAPWDAARVTVLGLDGWRGRWAGALLEGRSVRLLVLEDAAAALAVPEVTAIGVDMPVGLAEDGVRACDVAARGELRGRGAAGSVFPAPVRAVLATADHASATAVSRAVAGRGISVQTWGLVRSIRQLDDALGDPPDARVAEVHPELSFRELDDRVRDPKATARGLGQRLRALQPVMDVLGALAEAPAGLPVVDALDACAAAWSAARVAAGTARRVGDDAVDARGRRMRISW
jgi:predicted RNase H-like nuclease